MNNKITIIIFLIITCSFSSCNNVRNNYKETSQAEFDSLLSAVLKENQRNDDLIYVTEAQIDSIRDKYRGNYEESLPMGVHFGNSEKEYDKRYNSLLNQGEIFQYSSSGIYAYKYKINDYRIWAVPYPKYERKKMKPLKLICWDTDGENSHSKLISSLSKIYGKPYFIDKKYACFWYRTGLEICLEDELINNDPYPAQLTGVLYYNNIK